MTVRQRIAARSPRVAGIGAVIGAVTVAVAVAVLGATPAFGYGRLPPVISLSTSTVPAGGSLVVDGNAFTPSSKVVLTLHSRSVYLAAVTSDAKGRFHTGVTIPASVPAGLHLMQALDVASGDLANAQLTVTAKAAPPPPAGGGGGGGLAGTGVAIAGLGGLGVALLVCGQALIVAGRRRRTRA